MSWIPAMLELDRQEGHPLDIYGSDFEGPGRKFGEGEPLWPALIVAFLGTFFIVFLMTGVGPAF